MLNIFLMLLTVIFGVSFLWILRQKSELSKIVLVIVTFSVSRIFFRLAWQSITGGVLTVLPTAHFYLLLSFNFLALSVFFISAVTLLTKQRWSSLGWTVHKIGKNVLLGFILGFLLFCILTYKKNLKPENLPAAIFLSLFLASWQEENIFRGHLIVYLNQKFDFEEAIIYQAFVFALAHIGFYAFFPIVNLTISLVFAFVFGAILGYLRLKTRSQIPGFVMHGIVNIALLIS